MLRKKKLTTPAVPNGEKPKNIPQKATPKNPTRPTISPDKQTRLK